jgi:hypothetical protein
MIERVRRTIRGMVTPNKTPKLALVLLGYCPFITTDFDKRVNYVIVRMVCSKLAEKLVKSSV